MQHDDDIGHRRSRLHAVALALAAACAEADALEAHLLAAKIEDSRVCAETMIAQLPQ